MMISGAIEFIVGWAELSGKSKAEVRNFQFTLLQKHYERTVLYRWGAKRGYRIVEIDDEHRIVSYHINAENSEITNTHKVPM